MKSERNRVALFATCIVDQLMPEVGVATVRLLRRAGYEVDFPPDQTCCGQPFFNSGFCKEATRLARRTIKVLEGHEAVVLPSGSCTSMIRMEYPHLLEESPRWYYAARRLAGKTFELSEFLVKEAGWTPSIKKPAENATVTYHDSCHMCRLLKLGQQPRQLLRRTGHQITEMEESDRCCGFGGVFSIRMPEVSNAMTADKLRRAAATNASTLVTADPGCLMQMRGMADKDNWAAEDSPQIKHLATVLEEATR